MRGGEISGGALDRLPWAAERGSALSDLLGGSAASLACIYSAAAASRAREPFARSLRL